MSTGHKRGAAARTNVPLKLLRTIYWIVFAIALIIVVGYTAFRLLVTRPDVGDQIAENPQVTINVPGLGDDDPDTPGRQDLILTRREGVYTCLLAGTDDGNGCADTIMLGVFDVNAKTASLISIPRDTLVVIDGTNYKINATFGLGGAELLCSTVSDMLSIPVDYYVMVELEAFAKIVNEIGGVWFTVPVDMDYEDPFQDLSIHINAGYQQLNGNQAMGVMRCRSCYVNADLGRVQTQRAFLTALVKQTVSLSNVSKVTSLIDILKTYVSSDMSLSTMVYFATQAIDMDLDTSLTSATLPGDWASPVIELRDDEVLELVNGLGIYKEQLPLEALNIRHK